MLCLLKRGLRTKKVSRTKRLLKFTEQHFCNVSLLLNTFRRNKHACGIGLHNINANQVLCTDLWLNNKAIYLAVILFTQLVCEAQLRR